MDLSLNNDTLEAPMRLMKNHELNSDAFEVSLILQQKIKFKPQPNNK